jgi:hypothetical protein
MNLRQNPILFTINMGIRNYLVPFPSSNAKVLEISVRKIRKKWYCLCIDGFIWMLVKNIFCYTFLMEYRLEP